MHITEKDLSYLYDIYQNCIDILDYTSNIKSYTFEKDRMRVKAVERSFEIIGIASNKLSKEIKDSLTLIPWKQMIGFRNIIAHDYGDIRLEKLWDISRNSIPELKIELENIDELREYIEVYFKENK